METKINQINGDITISDEAISEVAINAAKDVEGVSSFSNRSSDVINSIKKGSLNILSPTKVQQTDDDISVTIYINVKENVKVKDVCVNVQSNVKDSIQNMTGKLVSKVNVIATGIDFEEDETIKE